MALTESEVREIVIEMQTANEIEFVAELKDEMDAMKENNREDVEDKLGAILNKHTAFA